MSDAAPVDIDALLAELYDFGERAGGMWNLGPEGGARGGMIVAAGTPEEVASTEASHTGRYLRPMLPSLSAAPGASVAEVAPPAPKRRRKVG